MRKTIGKRGDTELLSREVMDALLVFLVAVCIVAFIYIQARGYGMKEQYLSKQIALIIDSAEPGTEIKLNTGEMNRVSIDTEKQEVFVQAVERSSGKKYPYFTSAKINSEINNKIITIVIT